MEQVLILSADKWRMTDEKTGEVRSGVTVHYINDYREDTDSSAGYKPIKAPAAEEVFDAIKKQGAPALFDLDFKTRPGKNGVPTLMRDCSRRSASRRQAWLQTAAIRQGGIRCAQAGTGATRHTPARNGARTLGSASAGRSGDGRTMAGCGVQVRD